jgi:hypothetical protein
MFTGIFIALKGKMSSEKSLKIKQMKKCCGGVGCEFFKKINPAPVNRRGLSIV